MREADDHFVKRKVVWKHGAPAEILTWEPSITNRDANQYAIENVGACQLQWVKNMEF